MPKTTEPIAEEPSESPRSKKPNEPTTGVELKEIKGLATSETPPSEPTEPTAPAETRSRVSHPSAYSARSAVDPAVSSPRLSGERRPERTHRTQPPRASDPSALSATSALSAFDFLFSSPRLSVSAVRNPPNPLDTSLGVRYNGKRMTEDYSPFLPLSPAALHILLSLAAEDRHGYAIMQEVARQSEGQYKLGPGTLYDNLQKLMNQGLVEASPQPPAHDDPRRRYFRLTSFGRGVLSADVARLDAVVREARAHLSTPRRAT